MLHLKKEKILLHFSEIIALLQHIKLPSVILHYISLIHLVAFVLLHYMKTPTNQSILRLSLLLSLRPNACMYEVFSQVLFSGLLCLAAFLLSFYICCGKPDSKLSPHHHWVSQNVTSTGSCNDSSSNMSQKVFPLFVKSQC